MTLPWFKIQVRTLNGGGLIEAALPVIQVPTVGEDRPTSGSIVPTGLMF